MAVKHSKNHGYYGRSRSTCLIITCRVAGLLQIVSSCAVLVPIIHFIRMLGAWEFAVPKTFYFLGAVAATTLILLTLTSILSLCRRLRPLHNLIFSSILTSLWVACFVVVFARLRNVLFRQCSNDNWANDSGTRLCYLYKIILGGVIGGFASSLVGVVIDIVLYRQQPPKIKYTKAHAAGIDGDQEVLVARTGQDGQQYDAADAWPNSAYVSAQPRP
ncbi:hypothetical protein QBC44DRAFT_366120 [Cladorrhinum sp. PSN332]|nr:hypothetical protein QBC44DRAFT_366120 [Cladorrhinum sp. PSN332]